MIKFCLLLIVLLLTACAVQPLKNSQKTYLFLELPYQDFEKLRLKVEEYQDVKLKHRGEAHITVLTPPEYKELKKKISSNEIEELAEKMNLPQSHYTPICVGRGQKENEKTYFLVVKSKDLLNLRRAVQKIFIERGGDKADFDPEAYNPHVTLGFTQKDLHLEDGIKKDANSCIYYLHPQ